MKEFWFGVDLSFQSIPRRTEVNCVQAKFCCPLFFYSPGKVKKNAYYDADTQSATWSQKISAGPWMLLVVVSSSRLYSKVLMVVLVWEVSKGDNNLTDWLECSFNVLFNR